MSAVRRRSRPTAARADGRGAAARLPSAPGPLTAVDAALVLACCALALWTYRRALGGFFSPDDLIVLERIRGILPPQPVTLWRFLSGTVYFRAVLPWFGADPFPYHVVNWLLHAVNVGLLYLWVRRWGGGPLAATLAAGLFGSSRYFLTVIQQATGIGELAGMTFALAALLCSLQRSLSARIASLGLFVAALLSKESVLLLPLVLLLPRSRGEALRLRWVRAAPLLVSGLVLAGYLAASRVQASALGGEAYATGWGMNLFHDLMTYSAWAVDLRTLVPDMAGGFSTTAWRIGLPVTFALAALAALSWRRSPAGGGGALWWLLGLVPVLPLLQHSYLAYLYVPLAGFAMTLGAGVEWGMGRWFPARAAARSRSRALPWRAPAMLSWVVVAAAILAHAARSGAMLDERARARVPGGDLPLDSFVRKCEVARRVADRFGRSIQGDHVNAVFLTPYEGALAYDVRTGRRVSAESSARRYALTSTVLDQGRALRALYPNVDSVAFVDHWIPGYEDFDLFLLGAAGRIRPLGRGLEAQVSLATLLLSGGLYRTAREQLAVAVEQWPDDARLRLNYCAALAQTGEREAGLVQLEEILRRTPADSLAQVARQVLKQARAGAPPAPSH
jgi:hypothetical protein